jgi:prepilin-type N-terminal cleavage/methylation domain-containing protein
MRGSKGFTLVEIIVTIAILSVLSGIAILRITTAREEAAGSGTTVEVKSNNLSV